MYEISLKLKHDCTYSRIAALFDTAIYEFCSDLYDMLVVPEIISEDKMGKIKGELSEPSSLEIYSPNENISLTYLYFKCMCNRTINVVPTVERYGGMIQYPIRYEGGSEYYTVISLNKKTQQSVLKVLDHISGLELIGIKELGPSGIFRSQFLAVNQILNSITDRQIEVLVKAYKEGYYQIPREVRTQDLADDFGVSRTATEKSLRKAENQIIENVIPYLIIHQRLFNHPENSAMTAV